MKKLRFLGSGAFSGGYAGKFGCSIGVVSPPLSDEDADYLIRKMPGCWELAESKANPPPDPEQVKREQLAKVVQDAQQAKSEMAEESEKENNANVEEIPKQDALARGRKHSRR